MATKKLSPMMGHYLATKEKHKDCILFYRLGDFYEMFFEDAEKVTKLLGITLTGKDCGLDERAPMCGIPYHAADGYIAKLVALGERVAICEQLTNPTPGSRELVERDVVRIISAGTLTENSLLDEKKNNYICSVSQFKDSLAVAWTDITTGDFFVQTIVNSNNFDRLIDLIGKISPSEIITNQELYLKLNKLPIFLKGQLTMPSIYKEWAFNPVHAQKAIEEHFNVLNLNGLGIQNDNLVISAVGSLLEYLTETQKHALVNINKIEVVSSSEYMSLDQTAVKNLELFNTLADGKKYGSVLWLLDHTQTAMGSRMLNLWLSSPLQSVEKINYRQNGVEELYKNPLLFNSVRDVLSSIRDTERLSGKISNNNITPRDCLSLASSLSVFPSVKFILSGTNSKILNDVSCGVEDFSDLTKLLQIAIDKDAPNTFKEGGYIANGFDKELDRLRALKAGAKDAVIAMENREREATGIKNLKITFNKVFGYSIEVSNSFKEKVPFNYIRRQTLKGAERFVTEELKVLEEEVLGSSDKILRLESEIFDKIKIVLLENIKKIQRSSKAIAAIDVLSSFAYIAKKNNYVKPQILGLGEGLEIIGGRHPVVEEISSEQFISNDCHLNVDDRRMMIITGPNMAGKSTYMRQVALIAIMAHIGCYVPAKMAKIPIIDKVFTRVGASDNLIFEQSTFMVEMNEVALILNKATKNSLLILDEVGRGTSTYDGLSIAWAVVEYITKEIKAKTMFATHYHELSELEGQVEGVKNYKFTVKEFNGMILFLRKVQEGSANKSFGIEVASLAGVPKVVTDNAKQILSKLEKTDLNVSASNVQTKLNKQDDCFAEIKKIIKNTDVDTLSPREALELMYELKGIIKEK